MSALAVSAIIFLSTLGGIFLGTLLRRTLPSASAAQFSSFLEMSRPFTGLLRLSSVPLRSALGTI
jgi:hypothetical protein